MFTILGGREYFYQWDLNQKITVEDASIAELHFSTMLCSEALVCPVKDGAADVPNVLLQKGAAITVYGYCGKCYTKVERTFKVMPREKPADYVYTETEVKTYSQLENRIKGLEENSGYTKSEIDKTIGEIDNAISEIDNAVNNMTWKLIAEVKTTEEQDRIVIDFGAPITDNWYSETLISIISPANSNNSAKLMPLIYFVASENEINENDSEKARNTSIFACQSANIGALENAYKINALFHTEWLNKSKALFTELKQTMFNANSYPYTNYSTSNINDISNWGIYGNQFLIIRDNNTIFKFAAGTVVRFYVKG